MRFSPGCGCCDALESCVISENVFDLVNTAYGSWPSGTSPDRWIINDSGLKYSDISLSTPWYTSINFHSPNNLLLGPLELCWDGSGLNGIAMERVGVTNNIDGWLGQPNITPSGDKFGIEVLSTDTSGNFNIRLLGGFYDENNYSYISLESVPSGFFYNLTSNLGQRINGIDYNYVQQGRTTLTRPDLSYIYDFNIKNGYSIGNPDCDSCNDSCCNGSVPEEITIDLTFTGTFTFGGCTFDCSQMNGTYIFSKDIPGDQYCTWVPSLSVLWYYECGGSPQLINGVKMRLHANYGYWTLTIQILFTPSILDFYRTVSQSEYTSVLPCSELSSFSLIPSIGCSGSINVTI